MTSTIRPTVTSRKEETINNWNFTSVTTPMYSHEESSELSQKLDCHFLPEMVFNSHISVSHKNSLFSLEFRASDALFYATTAELSKNKHLGPIKVNFVEWEKKRREEGLEEQKDKIDWTFTSTYSGTIHGAQSVHETTEQIDYNMLKEKQKILFYDEILLYEDELHDWGSCKFHCKIRVMETCIFILTRCFLRVDNALVRVIDHRFFHVFGKDYWIREYTLKSSKYDEINDPNPSLLEEHVIDSLLTVIEKKNDKIQL
jgi:type 2A phosphatase activator TIP41